MRAYPAIPYALLALLHAFALVPNFGFHVRSIRELVTTLTLENAIAAPANDGLR